jgi:hypothetical protein
MFFCATQNGYLGDQPNFTSHDPNTTEIRAYAVLLSVDRKFGNATLESNIVKCIQRLMKVGQVKFDTGGAWCSNKNTFFPQATN